MIPVYVSCFAAVPTGPPSSVEVQPINSTSIIVHWQQPLDNDRNGIILNYVIEVTSIESASISRYNIELSEELVVGSLQPFAAYGVSVAAENSIGVGPFSPIELVQTLEDGNCLLILTIITHINLYLTQLPVLHAV